MTNHDVSNPTFNPTLRKFETSDPGHADVFNSVIKQLINNDVSLAAQSSEKASLILDANEPITEDDNTFWYKDMGETPINFNNAGDGVYTENATVSTIEPTESGLWFQI